jgi:hypothetical protein
MKSKYLYKIAEGNHVTTNMLYTPSLTVNKNILCMDWNLDSDYHVEQSNRTQELLDFFFDREVKHILLFRKYGWCPKLFDINLEQKKIYIEFTHETLSHIVNDPSRSLNSELPDWKEQLYNILVDTKREGYYKTALYPHCFFIKNGVLKTFDYYGCVDMSHPYIERNSVEGMIGPGSLDRFNMATSNGLIDFNIFYKYTLNEYLSKTWADNPFPEFYKRIYE